MPLLTEGTPCDFPLTTSRASEVPSASRKRDDLNGPWGAPPPAIALPQRRDRLQLDVAEALVAQLVLLDEQLAVEPERIGIGAQEALDVRRARQEVPFLVLQSPQVLGADLRLALDLRDVDPRVHARLPQGGADVRHRAAKATGGVSERPRRAG